MFHTIEFGRLSTILVDFIDHTDGLWFLRLVGPEPTANAIWARLSAREYRGQKWKTEVVIPIPSRSYPERVGLAKQMTYRTLRQRLPSGMVDLALVHPGLTVSEDKPEGFYLLTYEANLPTGFYDRLNACLTIPLKPDWAAWLWQQGQRPFTQPASNAAESGVEGEEAYPVETTVTPIVEVSGLGTVVCYQVKTGDAYKEAWLAVVRDRLAWGSWSGNAKE